jgi:hypothetical protein
VNALAAAVQELEAAGVPLDVPWGAVYRVRIHDADLPASGASGGLGAFRVMTFQPDRDGRQRVVHGDTFVLAVEFAEAPRARALLSLRERHAGGLPPPHRPGRAGGRGQAPGGPPRPPRPSRPTAACAPWCSSDARRRAPLH